jgi:hypothetical protein
MHRNSSCRILAQTHARTEARALVRGPSMAARARCRPGRCEPVMASVAPQRPHRVCLSSPPHRTASCVFFASILRIVRSPLFAHPSRGYIVSASSHLPTTSLLYLQHSPPTTPAPTHQPTCVRPPPRMTYYCPNRPGNREWSAGRTNPSAVRVHRVADVWNAVLHVLQRDAVIKPQ